MTAGTDTLTDREILSIVRETLGDSSENLACKGTVTSRAQEMGNMV